MAMDGRARARAMVEPGVNELGRGKIGARVNPKLPSVVSTKADVKRMAATNPPQPGFKKGGAVKKAMGGPIGMPGFRAPRVKAPSGAAPVGVPRMAKPRAPTGMPNFKERVTKPGGMKKGGKVHSDAAEDKKLIAKMIAAAEKKEPPGYKKGGAVCKADGGRISREDRDEAADDEAVKAATAPGGFNSLAIILPAMSPRAKGMLGDRFEKASANERAAFQAPGVRKMAAGGAAKVRKGVATPSGAPKNAVKKGSL